MTPELQKYYEAQFDLFASQGWKDLIEDFREMEKATNRLSGVALDDVRFKQGEISIMNLILQREQMFRDAYDKLKEEDDAPV